MVQVFGEDELIKLMQSGQEHYSHLISIGNPRSLFGKTNPGQFIHTAFKHSFKEILRLEFFDVEDREQLGPMRPRRIPMPKDIRKAIHFYYRTKNYASGYTFHCWRGISRSPAFALGYLYLITGSEAKAGMRLREIRPEAMPLKIVVRYFDEELKCNLSVVNDDIRRERITDIKKELRALVDNSLEELPVVEE
jgi:predicted protein tyrosine phosphatase